VSGIIFSSLGMASISRKKGTQQMENRIKILFFGGKGVCRMSEPCIIKKAPSFHTKCLNLYGGAEQDRTVDLLTASQALSQLSYSPT
jgi:hypothetical protein